MAGFLATLILLALAGIGLYLGLKLARVMGEQFEELLPQRMVDYSGFVDVPPARDGL
ncbi:hypothetical protein PbB2_01232 [Candidatus Phycosocius bacilliformis]|uniref:Uncharacterized protein n=1 Tax=Candidatus Phycosocius bacilliformis TaxID=1445552 RepID=A0A2P2E935_9PROT|nr:hypothetical protein [Candidatus Phycosocius bacilliformis]GBF57565.1 hypothetical protein PbB2_01232 [Candidatus Phycosocius bacilliformis]